MKKNFFAFILAGLAIVAMAEDGGAKKDDGALDKAKQKYEQRHGDEGKESPRRKKVLKKKKKIVTTKKKRVVKKSWSVFDVDTYGNPDASDYKVVVKKRPVRKIHRNRSFLRFVAFLGLADFLGIDDVDININVDADGDKAAASESAEADGKADAESGKDDAEAVAEDDEAAAENDEAAAEDVEIGDAADEADDGDVAVAEEDDAAEDEEAYEDDEIAEADDIEDEQPADEEDAPEPPRYFPIVLSVVPGVCYPANVQDTNISIGMIGSATRKVDGISCSGVFDIIEESLLGVQTAGVFSIAGGKVLGAQVSGVFNIGGMEMQGVQAAGVFNIAEDVKGVQAAGVFNVAEDVKGVQTAGVANFAHDVTGLQVAGVINVANDVRGTQVGLVNVSENCYGIPIGLINITKNGIRDVGFWMDEGNNLFGFWANGTNNFYTLLFAGESLVDYGEDWNTFAAGFGLGARANLGPLHLDTDVSAKAFYGDTWGYMLDDLMDGSPRARDYYAACADGADPADPWPYGPVQIFPMVRMTLGIPVFKFFEVFGGVSCDIGVNGTYPVPGILQDVKGYGFEILDTPIEVYPHFFWGIRI